MGAKEVELEEASQSEAENVRTRLENIRAFYGAEYLNWI